MPPASASIGNVRTPPGRCCVTRAKKSSNARPKKKLKPRSRATLVGDGAVSMTERQALVAANGRRRTDGHETIVAGPAIANSGDERGLSLERDAPQPQRVGDDADRRQRHGGGAECRRQQQAE